MASKRQLQVEIENLEARCQMIAAAKATSNYQFDDSRLGRVKELVAGLRSRLEVSEKLVNAEVYYHDEIPSTRPRRRTSSSKSPSTLAARRRRRKGGEKIAGGKMTKPEMTNDEGSLKLEIRSANSDI